MSSGIVRRRAARVSVAPATGASHAGAQGSPPAPAHTSVEDRRRAQRRRAWAWRIAGYVAFLATWQVVAVLVAKDFVVPPPLVIVNEMWRIITSGELLVNFGATLKTIAIGLTLALAIGTAAGVAMGRSRWWNAFLGDWVVATMTTPGLIFALVTAVIFGLSPIGPIIATVVTSYSFVAVNVVEGVRALPKDLGDMARAFGVSRWRFQRDVIMPALAPYFFTALRYGFSVAWKIVTLTEVIVGSQGLGFMMRREFQQFSVPGFLAWVLLFFALALFLERVVLQRQIDRHFRWRADVAS